MHISVDNVKKRVLLILKFVNEGRNCNILSKAAPTGLVLLRSRQSQTNTENHNKIFTEIYLRLVNIYVSRRLHMHERIISLQIFVILIIKSIDTPTSTYALRSTTKTK